MSFTCKNLPSYGLQLFLFSIITIFLCTTNTQAAGIIGQWGTGNYRDIHVSGTLAGCAAGGSGLDIIDISDPANPVLLSNFDTTGGGNGVFLSGATAYIADGNEGLQIIDISNPAAPSLLGTYDTDGGAQNVQVIGTRAYVADSNAGFKIVDVSNPEAPTLLGSYDTQGYAEDVFVNGATAYIVERSTGLEILDISNPAAPQLLSQRLNNRASGIWVEGNIACFIIGYDGFELLNISNPASPQLLGSLDFSAPAEKAQIVGNKLYLADRDLGLRIFDITDPATPSQISSHELPGSTRNLVIAGTTAFMACDGGGLNLVNIANAAVPADLGRYDHSGDAKSVWVAGSTAYLAKDDGNLQIIDISNPQAPTRIGHFDHDAGCVQTVGDIAYVGGSNKFRVVDVTVPANPTELGNCNLPGEYCQSICVTGNTAYIANHTYGLQIIDISDPANPTVTGFYSPGAGNTVHGVYVLSNTAYVACFGKGLDIVDVSNPQTPTLLGTYDTPWYATNVTVVGTTAYIADSWGGLQIVNVANPANPVHLGDIDLPDEAENVQVIGNRAYVVTLTGNVGNLKTVDISDPTLPQVVETIDTAGAPRGLHVVGNKAFIAEGSSGRMLVIDLTDGSNSDVYFPHAVCAEGWTTEVALINTGTVEARGELFAYDDQGVRVGRATSITLNPRGRRSVRVNTSFANAETIGYLVFRTGSQNLVGYTKFYHYSTGYRVALPTVTKIDDTTLYVSHIASTDKWWTGIALLNTTNTARNLTITFSDGQTKPIELAANTHKAISIRDLFAGTAQPQIASAVITNCSGIVGLELFGSLGSGRQLSGISLSGKTSNTIYYPYITADPLWWTGIVAYDPAGTNRTLTITPYTKEGTTLQQIIATLPAGEKKYLKSAAEIGLPANAAWIQIEAASGITGFELFGTNDGLQLAGYTGVGLKSKKGIFAKIEQDGGWTGLALVNSESTSANVTLRARNNFGELEASLTQTLDPHERLMDTAETIFAGKDISKAYYISYESDRELVGFQMNGEGRLLDALPALHY
ncbi:MAG: hypothetical protein U9N63_06550 [Pseudomonadota bacterium]|nr:hypothetical protein [Pseudomonadota bacterium]